jgi:hypothetical protein
VARRALVACGVISSVLYIVAIDVVAPYLHPDYHAYASQMVSELFALGAPSRAALYLPMVLYNLLVFGFGACSTAGLLIAPMELRAAGVSEQTLLHIWGTVLQGVFIALVLVFGAFVHGARFRLYSLATLAICIVFGALASLEAAQASMRWIGLTERVNIYAWMLWLAVLALSLLPTQRQDFSSPVGARPRHRLSNVWRFITRRPVLTYFVTCTGHGDSLVWVGVTRIGNVAAGRQDALGPTWRFHDTRRRERTSGRRHGLVSARSRRVLRVAWLAADASRSTSLLGPR